MRFTYILDITQWQCNWRFRSVWHSSWKGVIHFIYFYRENRLTKVCAVLISVIFLLFCWFWLRFVLFFVIFVISNFWPIHLILQFNFWNLFLQKRWYSFPKLQKSSVQYIWHTFIRHNRSICSENNLKWWFVCAVCSLLTMIFNFFLKKMQLLATLKDNLKSQLLFRPSCCFEL